MPAAHFIWSFVLHGQTERFLESRGFFAALDPIAEIGNTYSASLYVSLAYLLADRAPSNMEEYQKWVDGHYEGNVFVNHLRTAIIDDYSFCLAGIREDGYREYRFNTT